MIVSTANNIAFKTRSFTRLADSRTGEERVWSTPCERHERFYRIGSQAMAKQSGRDCLLSLRGNHMQEEKNERPE